MGGQASLISNSKIDLDDLASHATGG